MRLKMLALSTLAVLGLLVLINGRMNCLEKTNHSDLHDASHVAPYAVGDRTDVPRGRLVGTVESGTSSSLDAANVMDVGRIRLPTQLPLELRFAADSSRSQAKEQTFRKYIEDTLDDQQLSGIDCTDEICKLSLREPVSRSFDELTEALSQSEVGRLIARIEPRFAATSIATDTDYILFIEIMERNDAAELQLLMEFFVRFDKSGAYDDCRARHLTPGTVRLTVSVDTAAIRVRVSGRLAAEPAGFCVRDSAELLARDIRMPAVVDAFPETSLDIEFP